MYVTATVPFVFLGIMFVRGVTLDGAAEGMREFVTPDFGKLLTFQVPITFKELFNLKLNNINVLFKYWC